MHSKSFSDRLHFVARTFYFRLFTGQLAEATITGFDDNGTPNTGTITIDHNANGVGWFIDFTPLENSEFIAQDIDSYLLAATESEASDKYDLLTTVLHELAHLYGFIDGYQGFDANIETEDGTTKFIGDDFEAILNGEHLDKQAHPHDLMNTHLAPGVRKLPSELNVQILQAILAEDAGAQGSPKGLASHRRGAGEKLEASLTSDPLLAIALLVSRFTHSLLLLRHGSCFFSLSSFGFSIGSDHECNFGCE